MKRKERKYIDLDVVNTREHGIRVITDLNNIGMEPNKNKDDLIVSLRLNLPQKGCLRVTRTLKDHVGNHVRIIVQGKKLQIIKLREIDCRFFPNYRDLPLTFNERKDSYNKYLDEYRVLRKRSRKYLY